MTYLLDVDLQERYTSANGSYPPTGLLDTVGPVERPQACNKSRSRIYLQTGPSHAHMEAKHSELE